MEQVLTGIGNSDTVSAEKAVRTVALASLIGTTVEWYDFFLYGTVTGLVFNKLFFPSGDAFIATALAYTVYAVGFATRPLGGILFGHFGDKIGRKPLLIITLTIMGVSTFLVGLVPSYESIGIAAPLILLFLRLLQGIGLGGEWGGAVLMAFEYAPPRQARPVCGLPADRAGCRVVPVDRCRGLALVDADRCAVHVVGLAARLHAQSRAGGRGHVHPAEGARDARVCAHQGQPARGARAAQGDCAGLPSQRAARLGGALHRRRRVQRLRRVRDFLSGGDAALPENTRAGGSHASRIGARRDDSLRIEAVRSGGAPSRVRLGAMACGLSSIPALAVMHYSTNIWWVSLAVILPLGVVYAFVYGPEASMFCELFDTRVRYTGISVVYQVSGIVSSSITPLVAATLLEYGGHKPWWIAVYVVAVGCLSAACAAAMKKTY